MIFDVFRKQYTKKELTFDQALHVYRCLKFLNILYSRALSTFFLPIGMFLAQFTIVVTATFTILFYDQIGLLNTYVALSIVICNIFVI